MVLFGESDEDIGFGSHLIERCEDAGLKMFVPQRDLVAGTIEHETSSKIISERCRKVIAVFSPTFLESERNMFLTGTVLLIENFLSKLFVCSLKVDVIFYPARIRTARWYNGRSQRQNHPHHPASLCPTRPVSNVPQSRLRPEKEVRQLLGQDTQGHLRLERRAGLLEGIQILPVK